MPTFVYKSVYPRSATGFRLTYFLSKLVIALLLIVFCARHFVDQNLSDLHRLHLPDYLRELQKVIPNDVLKVYYCYYS